MKLLPSLTALCLALGCLAFCPGVAGAAGYVLTDLGSGSAVDINNSGVVALNDAGHAYRVVSGERGLLVFWYPSPGDGSLISTDMAAAAAINDAGHVAGTVAGGAAFLDRGDTNRFFFGYYAGTFGLGLNNLDEAVGTWVLMENVIWTRAITLSFWPTNSADTLPSQNFGELHDVNDAGIAVGLLADSSGTYRYSAYRARAIKFQGGQVTYLDPRSPGDLPIYENRNPSVRLSEAHAVNFQGDVVGEMALVADGPKHAFRHVGAGMEDLGTLGGETSAALDINDQGVIVGSAKTAAGDERAFLWKQGTMTDLNSLVPAGTGFTLVRALAINNAGQIVGDALVGGQARAFLVSPANLGSAPRITQQPVGGTLALDGSITLAVAATGSLPLAYQWQKGNNPIAGANTLTLQLTNVTAFDDGDYRAVVTNAFGKVISQSAKVVVLDPRLKTHALVGLTLEGSVGASYRIEFTPTLGAVDWQPLETVTLTNAMQWWLDLGSSEPKQRTYRAIRLP